ncbi:hypothetical protein [Streptosporangium minutum]|nr:hypothetical protein [Streptosporangium minutum]
MRTHDARFAGMVTAVMLAAVVVGEPAAMGVTTATEAQHRPECTVPSLPGHVVDVTLADTGSRMMSGGPGPQDTRMRLSVTPATVPAGTVSLRVANTGALAHEVLVLPLPSGQTVGQREPGSDQRVDEADSLGEASHDCAAGKGEGIAPDSKGWITLTLRPGRYELVCNFPDHYARGMYAELDVTGR